MTKNQLLAIFIVVKSLSVAFDSIHTDFVQTTLSKHTGAIESL